MRIRWNRGRDTSSTPARTRPWRSPGRSPGLPKRAAYPGPRTPRHPSASPWSPCSRPGVPRPLLRPCGWGPPPMPKTGWAARTSPCRACPRARSEWPRSARAAGCAPICCASNRGAPWSGSSPGPASAAEGRLPSAAGFRLSGLGIPRGMSLWAASAFHPGAISLQEGADLRMEGDAADTLVLWAAPTGTWREGDPVPGMKPLPALRAARLARGAYGLELRVDLPASAGVKAGLHSADGRRLGFWENPRMAPGYHAIPLSRHAGPFQRSHPGYCGISDAAGDSRRAFKVAAAVSSSRRHPVEIICISPNS